MKTKAVKETTLPVIMPDKMLLPHEIEAVVTHSLNILLEKYSKLEGYVILHQMEKIVELAKERLKEGAITKITGKSENVMGAEVTLRRTTSYEYEAPTLARMDAQKKEIDGRMKAIKKVLEATGTYADTETGEMNTATKTKEGVTIAVTLPKGGTQ